MGSAIPIVIYVSLGTIGGVVLILVITFLVLSAENSRRQDRAQLWGAEYGVRQVRRAGQKFSILSQIGAPECPDGTYSPLQLHLWKQYQAMDIADRKLTAQERNGIVELRGYS